MRHLRRGGPYLRVADTGWRRPLAREYSLVAGGRWNAPGSFGVVYLNATPAVARAQVRIKARHGLRELNESGENSILSVQTIERIVSTT